MPEPRCARDHAVAGFRYSHSNPKRHTVAMAIQWGMFTLGHRNSERAMISVIPYEVLFPFGFFGLFLFYQAQHHSSGALPPGSPEIVFSLSIAAGGLCNLAFLIYFGLRTTWWAPFLLILLFLPFLVIGVIGERIIGRIGWAALGFVGWPVCAYLMFSNTP